MYVNIPAIATCWETLEVRRGNGRNVRPTEVPAFVQQRLSADGGEGVGEAVPVVEASGMPPLAEPAEGPPRCLGLLRVNADKGDACSVDERCDRHDASVRGLDGLVE